MVDAPVFELFGPTHLATLGVVLGVSVAVPLWARGLPSMRIEAFARVLAVVLVVYRTAYVVQQVVVVGVPLRQSLPLHVCGILFYLCAYMLWTRSYAVYEVAYFWGLGGTLQALVTPDVAHGFPHPQYIDFFLSHGALVFTVLFATFAFRFRPRVRSIFKALAVTLLYAALLLPVNLALGTNYMFLLRKPAGASLLDFLGPWPWYVVGGIGVAFVTYLIWYLPFALADGVRARRPA